MKCYAYAKLNLALKILGQRPDGYHELDMLMQLISLRDEITICKSAALNVFSDLPLPSENTMTKAARLFFAYTKICGGAQISVEKKIPEQAGLGGGSSDGAAVLTALNEIYGTGLSTEELIVIGQQVGADVPFFLVGGCARARGTGEKLSPVENNMGGVYVIAKPAGGVNTKDAYAKFHTFGGVQVDVDKAALALQQGDMADFLKNTGNDLMPAALGICPDIKKILEELHDAEIALMTGSGSCVFGLYADKKTASEKCGRLAKNALVDFAYVAENR